MLCGLVAHSSLGHLWLVDSDSLNFHFLKAESTLSSELQGPCYLRFQFKSRGDVRFRVLQSIFIWDLQAAMERESIDNGFNVDMRHNNGRAEAVTELCCKYIQYVKISKEHP